MAPKKKKTKATANSARGFATTSQPSKPRVVETGSDGVATREGSGTSTPQQAGSAVTGALAPTPGAQGDASIQEMSPDELEKHLEDAELQDMLNRNGARCRAESSRQVSRLKSERRQFRPQAYRLYTEDWLSDDIVSRVIARGASSDVKIEASAKRIPQSADEKVLTDLWILHRVLTGLGLPRVEDAISYVVLLSCQKQLLQTNYIPFGLTEALDWYALNCSDDELPDYEDRPTTRPPSPTTEEKKEDAEDETSKQATIPAKKSLAVPATNNLELAESESSDTHSDLDVEDDDPRKLAARWIRLQRRLWQRNNPETPGKSPNAVKTRRLQDRIKAIERDILFDKDGAQATWLPMQIELQKEHARRRKAAKVLQNQSNIDDALSNTPGRADYPAEDAAAEDGDVFGGMFGADESPNPEGDAGSEQDVRIVDFGKYTGLSPHQLLTQVCGKLDAKLKIKVKLLHQTSYAVRHSIGITWSKGQIAESYAAQALSQQVSVSLRRATWRIEMNKVAASNSSASLDYVSTLALFLVLSLPGQDFQVSRRLPTVWAHLVSDLCQEQKKLAEADDKAILRDLRKMVQRVSEDVQQAQSSRPPREQSTRRLESRPRGNNGPPMPPRMSNEEAQAAWDSRASGQAYQKMLTVRQQLPIYQHKDLILQTIADNPVSIICAETGSGKSTQAGSYILEHNLSQGRDCRILVTQPRRISAISLARRISQELGEGKNDLGTLRSLVGYAIRLESKTSEATRLTFATSGVLLRMLESSPTLDQLDYLILDEVHERSMEMDLAFIALRNLQQLRPNLKIVLMSATVNATQFSNYFGAAPILNIEGRTFPVAVKYLEDAIEATNDIGTVNKTIINEDAEDNDSDNEPHEASKLGADDLVGYSKATLRRLANTNEYRIDFDLIVKLCTAIATKPEFVDFSKAILIFLPGISEIRRLHSALLNTNTFTTHWDLHMLHSSFSTDELERAFAPPRPHHRKMVIATNIAETGITIPDITAVIDTCKEKTMRFDERRQLSRLTEGFVARSSASQRRGRAARVQPGLCFHLVTRTRHDTQLLPQQIPEMLRLSLQDSIMRIKLWDSGKKSLGTSSSNASTTISIADTLDAALDPPPRRNVTRAIERLKDAGALSPAENLTSLGRLVARLPLDVALAKLAVLGAVFGCLEPVVTIVALLTGKSIFAANTPNTTAKNGATTATGRAAFTNPTAPSDLLASLAAYAAYQRARHDNAQNATAFARKHGLLLAPLADVADARVQLLVYLADAGVLALSSGERGELNRARTATASSGGRRGGGGGGGRGEYVIPPRYNRPASDDLLLSLIAAAFYPRLLRRESPGTGTNTGTGTGTGNKGASYRNVFSNQLVSPAKSSAVLTPPRQAQPTWLCYAEAMQTRAGMGVLVQECGKVPDLALGVFLGGEEGDAGVSLYSGVLSVEGKVRLSVRRWRQALAVKVLRREVREGLERAYRGMGRGRVGVDGEGDEGGEGEWVIELLRGAAGEEKGAM